MAAYLAQQTLNALQVSAFYALLSLGYVLVHGVTNRINLTLGALGMWAGILAVLAATALGDALFLSAGAALLVGLPLAALPFAATGFLIARNAVMPLVHRPGLAMLVATIGVAIALEELARIAASGRDLWLQPVLAAPLLSGGTAAFPLSISGMQALAALVATAAVATTLLVLGDTHAGRLWRAVADDPRMAALLGVDVGRVTLLAVLAGFGLTGVAGVLAAALYGNASFHLGLVAGLKTLYVAVLGGLASPVGAVVGAVLLGAAETFWSAFLPIVWRDAATFAALTFLLSLRQAGRGPEDRSL